MKKSKRKELQVNDDDGDDKEEVEEGKKVCNIFLSP
jgi:hypothetical protein